MASKPADIDIRIVGLRKRYGDVAAVDGIDLEVGRGEFFTMLGPSGSGKTTTLRMIAGFERPDEGRIELGGADVSRRPFTKREGMPTRSWPKITRPEPTPCSSSTSPSQCA